MDIPPIHAAFDASPLALERLAHNPNLTEEQKVSELARQFESVLLRQILKNAQKTVIKSDYTDDSFSHEIYQDLMTAQLAESISDSGAFGLARSLEEQLTRQVLRPPIPDPQP